MKVPEGVLERFDEVWSRDHHWKLALEAALEQLREELLGDEAVAAAHDKALGYGGVSVHRHTIEEGIEAALNSVLGDKEEGR